MRCKLSVSRLLTTSTESPCNIAFGGPPDCLHFRNCRFSKAFVLTRLLLFIRISDPEHYPSSVPNIYYLGCLGQSAPTLFTLKNTLKANLIHQRNPGASKSFLRAKASNAHNFADRTQLIPTSIQVRLKHSLLFEFATGISILHTRLSTKLSELLCHHKANFECIHLDLQQIVV